MNGCVYVLLLLIFSLIISVTYDSLLPLLIRCVHVARIKYISLTARRYVIKDVMNTNIEIVYGGDGYMYGILAYAEHRSCHCWWWYVYKHNQIVPDRSSISFSQVAIAFRIIWLCSGQSIGKQV